LPGLVFTADASIVIRADTGVDVLSDNTADLVVLPSTTPAQQHVRAHLAVPGDNDRPPRLCVTTSTPSMTAQTIE
jgi:hypothetical protein